MNGSINSDCIFPIGSVELDDISHVKRDHGNYDVTVSYKCGPPPLTRRQRRAMKIPPPPTRQERNAKAKRVRKSRRELAVAIRISKDVISRGEPIVPLRGRSPISFFAELILARREILNPLIYGEL